MMQIVPKWKVRVQFQGREVVLWVHDTHIGNVLRKLADMQFTESGIEQPTKIVISE